MGILKEDFLSFSSLKAKYTKKKQTSNGVDFLQRLEI